MKSKLILTAAILILAATSSTFAQQSKANKNKFPFGCAHKVCVGQKLVDKNADPRNHRISLASAIAYTKAYLDTMQMTLDNGPGGKAIGEDHTPELQAMAYQDAQRNLPAAKKYLARLETLQEESTARPRDLPISN